MIPYGRQNISEEDVEVVVNVLKSDYLTQGPAVEQFENVVCEYTGAKYSVAVNSGTAALHVACLALGLEANDWLWTTPVTFVASANCALYCGAKVDFVDINSISWNIDITQLKVKLEKAKLENKLPKILVAVHLAGLSCEMEAIQQLSKEYGFKVIEDACHAIGGKYKGNPIGSCNFSDVTVFSFHPVKTITTGEGGMAVTNNKEIADKMSLLRSHGITRDANCMTHPPDGPWYYQQVDLGFNYRMSDIQAALGASQIKRLDEFVEKRHSIAKIYDQAFADLPLLIPLRCDDSYSGMHLYIIRVEKEKTKRSHLDVFSYLRENGIGVNLHYIPVHMQPYYKKMGFAIGDFPEAELYYSQAISLPMFPDLSLDQIDKVVKNVRDAIVN